MARITPVLPSQASATAVSAVAKPAPLHPEYPSGLAAPVLPRIAPGLPALQGLPDVTAHYPLND